MKNDLEYLKNCLDSLDQKSLSIEEKVAALENSVRLLLNLKVESVTGEEPSQEAIEKIHQIVKE